MLHLQGEKKYTQDKSIEVMPLPRRVYMPLSQHLGKMAEPVVNLNDSVLAGQLIAQAQAKVTSSVHASISGKVVAIEDWFHPLSNRCKTIIIENDGLDKKLSFVPLTSAEISELSPDLIIEKIQKAGIVGMGGAGFPTHVKLSPPKAVDTLIVNGAECEPYLTADYRLMVEKTAEIMQGIILVVKSLKISEVFIAIEDNKPLAIEAFRKEIKKLNPPHQEVKYSLCILKSAYPQGGEKQLIKSVLKKEVGRGMLPFELGVLVHNVATLFAIYEAVVWNKPLYERVVTVTGSCLRHPKNLLVRIGTPIKELIDFCELKERPAKIIIGGPMMGVAQFTDSVPVIKTTNGVVLLTAEETQLLEEMVCIRCGKCVQNCPMGLMPCLINLAAENNIWQQAKELGALDCIECGICTYFCPANRFLVQSIKRAKFEIAKLS